MGWHHMTSHSSRSLAAVDAHPHSPTHPAPQHGLAMLVIATVMIAAWSAHASGGGRGVAFEPGHTLCPPPPFVAALVLLRILTIICKERQGLYSIL